MIAQATAAAANAVAQQEVTEFRFLEAPPAWVIALVIVPVLLILVLGIYRREGGAQLAPKPRLLLAGLRIVAIGVLLLVLFRPVLETHKVEIEKAVLPILIDGSASMTRTDAYADADGASRLARLAGMADPAELATSTRVELVQRILGAAATDPKRTLAERNDVRLFSFGEDLRSLDAVSDLTADANYTRLGSALSDTLAEFGNRGDRVQEVLLVSDGRSNAGLDPAEAAQLAALDGVRVIAVGVGDPNEPKNVEIQSVRAPEVALVNDDVAFEVVISSKGYAGRVTALQLKMKGSDQVLATREVTLAQSGREQVEVLYWRPEREGEYDLIVEVERLPGEQFPDDNSKQVRLRVDPEQIKVLYVEGYPRWEYRFLKNILLRAKNMKAQCLLLDADKDFIQESSEGVPALTAFPPTREDLFKYDVIILGDVSPFHLKTSEEPAKVQKNLKEFVEIGGGLVMIAGVLDNPRSFAGTPLEDVLPVVLNEGEEERRVLQDTAMAPFRPRLENPLDPHEVVRLEKDLAENRKLWEDDEVGLPPQEWYYPVRKAKGGAEVMLRHPVNGNQFGKHVLLASTFHPAGRTLFVGFDSTWLWRRYYGDRYTERFWRGVIRYVALNKLRKTNKRFELLTDKSLYDIHEPIRISARIRDADFNPTSAEHYPLQLENPSGVTSTLDLTNIDPTEGLFKGTLHSGLPGSYQIWLEDQTGRESGRLSPRSFLVEVPRREWENPVLAKDVLESLAATTHGRYFGLDRFDEALASVQGDVRERLTGEPRRAELWSSWPALLIFLALMSAEWILRKKFNLI